LRGAAVPVKGAAGIILADARTAVRNNASRRVTDPVICVLTFRPLARPRDPTRAHKRLIKQAQIRPPAPRILPPWHHLSSDYHPVQGKQRWRALTTLALLCLALLLFKAAVGVERVPAPHPNRLADCDVIICYGGVKVVRRAPCLQGATRGRRDFRAGRGVVSNAVATSL
jgi:hypothetical protein